MPPTRVVAGAKKLLRRPCGDRLGIGRGLRSFMIGADQPASHQMSTLSVRPGFAPAADTSRMSATLGDPGNIATSL